MNLESHRTIVEGQGQKVLMSENNAVGTGADRIYLNNFENRSYKVSELDESIISSTPLSPVTDPKAAAAILSIGRGIIKTFIEESRRNLHFYSSFR